MVLLLAFLTIFASVSSHASARAEARARSQAYRAPTAAQTRPASLSLEQKISRTVTEFQKARSLSRWIDTTPGLSALERKGLKQSDLLAKEKLPTISWRRESGNRFYVSVNGQEFDFSYLRQGKILYYGRTIFVRKNMFLPEVAAAISKAMAPKTSTSVSKVLAPRHNSLILPWLSPTAAHAGGITKGCSTKDFFTLPDVVNSPFGFAPPIWISSAIISIMRWGGDQFRDCEEQISDLRHLLKENMLAVKALSCGSDQWGSDRAIEFWVPERKRNRAGDFRTRKFQLDYTNYFAEEEVEDEERVGVKEERAKTQRLYVFGEKELIEARLLTDTGADFYGDCQLLNAESQGEEARKFLLEKERIERYRKIFFYLNQHNTCTACREAETKIVSPRAPSYFPDGKPPAGSKPGSKASPGVSTEPSEVESSSAN